MGVIIVNEDVQAERVHGVRPEWNVDEHLDDYVFTDTSDSSTDESETNSVPPTAVPVVINRRRRVKDQVKRNAHGRAIRPAMHQDMNALIARRGNGKVGARKQRRLDNDRMLTAICDVDDICDDLSDMLPPSMGAFAHLFTDDDAMKNWQHFMDSSEVEQRRILIAADDKHRRCYLRHSSTVAFDIPSGSQGLTCATTPTRKSNRRHQRRKQRQSCNDDDMGGSTPPRSKSNRGGGNPTFSPSECFGRIDPKLRSILTNRHAPWGMIGDYEKELIDFFSTSSDGVYVNVFDDPFDRLVLHCVSQYLALKSKSTTHSSGTRETLVENPRPYFAPPRQTLQTYVQKKYPNTSL